MNDVVISIIVYASFVAIITRLLIYAHDPSKITRLDNGKIHWGWCLFNNTVRGASAVGAGVAVWFIVLPYFNSVTEEQKVAIASLSAIAGESIWLLLGYRIKKFVDKWMSDGLSNDDDDDDFMPAKKRSKGAGNE